MATPPKSLLQSLRVPVSEHPVFEPNQLLSFGDLELLRDYLDQQTRLTRVCLVGVGILCGLIPHRSPDSIEVSAGCGVTTEGLLIALEKCTLTHHKSVSLTRGEFLGGESTGSDEFQANELFDKETDEGAPLTASVIKDKIVALLIHYEDEKTEKCSDDCDEKGTQRRFKVRKLLLAKDDALAISEDGFNPATDDGRRFPDWSVDPDDSDRASLFTGKYQLDELYLERFGHSPVGGATPKVDLSEVVSYQVLKDRYGDIIDAGKTRIDQALSEAHRVFSPVFSGWRPDGPLPPLDHPRFNIADLKSNHPLEIQYVYDHLADLVLAYDELRDAAFDLMDVCRADIGWFPKHLLLGPALKAKAELPIPPSLSRTFYAQPPVYNANRVRVAASRLLFNRLRALIKAFALPDFTAPSVRITPSRWGRVPLSERALPFYYQPEKELHRLWNTDRHRKARDHRMYGYHRIAGPGNSNPPYDDPLVFDFEGHDFYRIAGHVGLEKSDAFERIQQLRQGYNLAFDLKALKLGDLDNIDHDCDLELWELQYEKLRGDLSCVLLDRKGEEVRELRDYLTNTELDDFRYADFKDLFDAVQVLLGVEGECLLDQYRGTFEKLAERYGERRERILAQHVFHRFAEKHPGMEHKAGVPRGGSFILVYNEDPADAKRQIIVADFCLPYLCCADCPPTEHVIARPRPTFTIDPMAFCANDDKEYDFEVDPVGGVISGLGVNRDGARYFFVPANTNVDEGHVDLRYVVDGAEANINVQIRAVPKADFDPIPPKRCFDQGRIPLKLATGTPTDGSFTTDIDAVDDQIGIVKDGGEVFFDPQADKVPQDQPIRITYTVIRKPGCEGRSHRDTRVLSVPQATFKPILAKLCLDQGRIPLTPATGTPTDGSFTTDIDAADDQIGIVKDGGQVFFDPTADKVPQDKQFHIIYTVISDDRCKGESQQQTQVLHEPNAGFTGLDDEYCQTHGPVKLLPVDTSLANSRFSGDGVTGNEFRPQDITIGGANTLVQVVHKATDAHDCQSSQTRQIRVFSNRDGEFEFGNHDATKSHLLIQIKNIQPTQSTAEDLLYRFVVRGVREDASTGDVLEEETRKSGTIELSVPRDRLREMKSLSVLLVVVNGPCETDPVEHTLVGLTGEPFPGLGQDQPLLESRLEAQREVLKTLAVKHSGLDQLEGFKKATELLDGDPSGPAKDLVEAFGDFADTLVRGYRRLTTAERELAFRSFATSCALTVIDRVAIEPGDDPTRTLAATSLKELEEVDIDLAELKSQWELGEMAKVLDDDRRKVGLALFD